MVMINPEINTSLLDDEEVQAKLEAYRNGEMHYNLTLVQALNTIEARDKEIESLKGQVADLRESSWQFYAHERCLVSRMGKKALPEFDKQWQTIQLKENFENTQQTAQDFESSLRKDERVKVLREIVRMADEVGCSECADYELKAVPLQDIEALITKEQA